MRSHLKLVLLVLSAVALFATLTLPAAAGDYYYRHGYAGGAYYGGHTRVWYSSSCCYRRIVRHVKSVRYVPVYRHRAYYHGYGRYYGHSYYLRPYRAHYSYYPHRYAVQQVGYYDSYATGCYWGRVRVDDHYGGWVWGRERICH